MGIGATTAIFTLMHAVLLKSLPVARPQQLFTAGDAKHTGVFTGMAVDWDIFSYDLYKHLRDHAGGFEELAAFQSDPRGGAIPARRRRSEPNTSAETTSIHSACARSPGALSA